ncbi:MAG TPA: dinitrogenase iron-molybdenum cofactor biosynthesis protein [Candidatus Marinimicrobia bacterium]|nr:dinitrogenase iron-molybdenum cofactor biosynthesis protein [Candidatus Neomarinimicrobiota bacterium]
MKIAFTTKGTDWDAEIDPRFGRTEYLLLYDDETKTLQSIDNREINQKQHGAGPQTAQKITELDVQLLITGNGPGGNAAMVLEKAGVRILTGYANLSAKDAYQRFLSEK